MQKQKTKNLSLITICLHAQRFLTQKQTFFYYSMKDVYRQ